MSKLLLMKSKMPHAYMFCVAIILMMATGSAAQTQVFGNNSFQTFASAGTTNGAATNGSVKLYSAIGQPMAASSSAVAQTQAGILSSVTSGVVVSDNVPPIIANAQASALTKGTTNANTFTATISDNVKVNTAKITYKKITSPSSSFADAPLVAGSTANTYSIAVQDSWYDDIGLEYYYTATDKAGNTTRMPATGSYYTYLTVPSVQVPSAVVSAGSALANYRIIAMPYSADAGVDINTVFGTTADASGKLPSGLAQYKDTKSVWRLATYESGVFKEYPSDLTAFKRGKGYWFIVKDPTTITLVGSQNAPAYNRSALFTITLSSGWNMIGNPYPLALKWSDVQGFAGNPALGDLSTWSSSATTNGVAGGFQVVTDWPAFQGGFVNNTTGGDLKVTIPFPGQTALGGRQLANLSTDISSPNWQIGLDIIQDNAFNKLARFGMIDSKQIGEEFKSYNPPAFESSPEINFNSDKLCRSIVSTSTNYTWKFGVTGATGQTTTLQWSNDLGSGTEAIYLLDEVSLKLTNMKETATYQFVLEDNHKFSILFASKDADVKPDNIIVLKPYPNPIQDRKTTFTIGLPDSANPYQAEIQVYGINGTLINANQVTLSPGIQSVIWEPEDGIKAGLYYYRVKVGSGENSTIQTGKLIVP